VARESRLPPRGRLACLLGSVAILGSCTAPPPEIELRQRAEEAFALGAFDEAEGWFEAALIEAPDDPVAALGLARVELARGDAEAALAIFEGLAAEPSSGHGAYCAALVLAGEQRLAADEPARALALARKLAVGRCGSASSDLLVRALVAEADRNRAQGRSPQAMSLYVAALEVDPRSLPATAGLAEVLVALGRIDGVDGAVALLSDGLLHHPDDRGLQGLMVEALGIRYPERSSGPAASRERSQTEPLSEPRPGDPAHD
jgi:thioredoxin-like negative regulator of GroEL